jgi:hypothetical protein
VADPYSGTEGRITCEGTIVTAEKWRVRETGTEVPANDYENDKRKNSYGLAGCEVEFSGYFDRNKTPTADPPAFRARTQVGDFKLFIDKSSGLCWNFPVFNVSEVEVSSEVDGRVDLMIRGKSHGDYFAPGT